MRWVLVILIGICFLSNHCQAHITFIDSENVDKVRVQSSGKVHQTTWDKLYIFQLMLNDALLKIPNFSEYGFVIQCQEYNFNRSVRIGIGASKDYNNDFETPSRNIVFVEVPIFNFELDKLLNLCTNIALDIEGAKALQIRTKLNDMYADSNYVQRLPDNTVKGFLNREDEILKNVFQKEYNLRPIKYNYQPKSKRVRALRFYYKNKLFHFYNSRIGKNDVVFKSKTLFQIEDFIEDISVIFISPLELYHTFNHLPKEQKLKPIKIPSRNDSLEKQFGYFAMQFDSKLGPLISFSYTTGEDYKNPENALLILSKDTIISGFKSKRDSLIKSLLPKEKLNANTEDNKPIPIILLILFGISLLILFIKAR